MADRNTAFIAGNRAGKTYSSFWELMYQITPKWMLLYESARTPSEDWLCGVCPLCGDPECTDYES